jgi:hypothetical protein
MFKNNIVVDLPAFAISISEYDAVVRTITNFSVGRTGHRTPLIADGSLSLTKRNRNHRSSIYPPPHGGAPMPYALFFQQAPSCAFHEGDPNVPSHGCIHLVRRDAAWLFDWAGAAPVGLTIRGPYPASPIPVQRSYRIGAPNMDTVKVAEIQRALKAADFLAGEPTGNFDVETDDAVRRYQAANGLVEDGIVGRNTAAKLGVTL